MRHGKKFNHLGRKAAHRKAMLANMACSLIEYKRIKTTLAKAKALRVYIEPLITKSKDDTTHSRRTVFSYLKQKQAITELFSDIATKVADRPGGYTRILKLSSRLGDNAQMAFIELVDYNEEYATDKPKRKKARRAKKQTGKAVEEAVVVEETSVVKEVVVEKETLASEIEEQKVEEITEVAVGEVVEEPISEETTEVEENKEEETVKKTVVTEEEAPVAETEEVIEEEKAEETTEVAAEEAVEDSKSEEETKEEANNSEEKKEKGE